MFLPSNITLKLGDSGDYVAELQRRLSTRDFLSADMITGMFDGATANSVRNFQSANGLRADGVAGPETLRRLNGLSDNNSDSARSNQNNEIDQAQINIRREEQERLLKLEADSLLAAKEREQEIELGLNATTPSAGLESTLSRNKNLEARTQDLLNKIPEVGQEISRGPTLGKRTELDGQNQEILQTKLQVQEQLQAQQKTVGVIEQSASQAFIDRPIAQSLQAPIKEAAPDATKSDSIEQAVGGHARGPALNIGPERANDTPAKSTSVAQGISAPKETVGAEISATQAPKKSMQPAQYEQSQAVTSPDFNRIRGQMESRLSPPVIQEVKQVGTVMVENGVNPARMPPSIEAPAQTPNTPERAPAVGGARGVS